MLLSFLFGGLALAWNIAGGYAGLISFGHSAFFGVGAYTSTILLLRYGVTPWIGIWAGALIAAVFGAVLALICARLRGPFFILSTLAFAEVVRIGALNWSSLTGGPEGLSIMPAPRPRQHGVCLEDRLRGADAGLSRRWSMPSPRGSKPRASAIICSRSATMRTPPARPASIRCWGAPRRWR